MIRIAAPVATTRATAKGLARAVLATREDTTKEDTTKEATTKAAQTREADANANTAKPSLTRTEGHMEPAEGRITLDATGATQLGGETLDVATCSLQKGFQKALCFS